MFIYLHIIHNRLLLNTKLVLQGCHSDTVGGNHFGRDKTFSKLSERFYWLGMVDDVKKYCMTCEECQRVNQ